uniref:Uncharacterized protein n=1 Tax=Moniliophthora roreri TaxID=221103 RepID=A0A0W0FID4_MONRR
MNLPSSTQSEDTNRDLEEQLLSLADSSSSSKDNGCVLSPRPTQAYAWATLRPIPEQQTPPLPMMIYEHSSTPQPQTLSSRMIEPLLGILPSPTALNEHKYSPMSPPLQLPPQCHHQESTPPQTPQILLQQSSPQPDFPHQSRAPSPMSPLPPLFYLTRTQDNHTESIWDVKDDKPDNRASLPNDRFETPMLPTMEQTE